MGSREPAPRHGFPLHCPCPPRRRKVTRLALSGARRVAFDLWKPMAENGWTAFGGQRGEADIHLRSGVVSARPKQKVPVGPRIGRIGI